MHKARILIGDDEAILTSTLNKILTGLGYSVTVCNKGQDLFQYLAECKPDLVLLDIYLGEVNGIQLLNQMRSEGITVPVIMMTAHSDVALAVRAMKEGAADFVVKPFDLNHLGVLIEKNLDYASLQTKVKLLEEELQEERPRGGIIGKSPALRRVLDTAEKLAQGDNTTVLLEGESGTGKELIARFIHEKSARAETPFITINCGAIPKDLAESEFFGYEKGAFTGATERMKQGKFELAHGGTILLDEVRELSLDMQVKLLRVLEERRFYRLGGTKEISVDVRVIAASNRELTKEVEAGRFREDLFYRLNVASIRIPPLRNRREDISELSNAFLAEFCRRFSRPVPRLSPEALQFLEQLPWKGNVRELRNAMERVVLLNNVQILTPEQFSFLRAGEGQLVSSGPTDGKSFVLEIPPRGITMNEVVRDLILKTLEIVGGNQVQAAKVLGLTRSKLRYRMEQLGIQPEQRTYRTNV
ncbi:MAG: two component, sigma54 specific, Fis family transcriptional regulator [Bacteroidetes bacterium]|nr:two component, sigma54 specific, Fis family transcriptional regulator [Bacteroidota bacterium]